ncbi:uracil-DNA glycosylase family protein [Mariniflexile sp.]|uniref:uracil-DNA glycosylase family protein n=1 Tax=Mariniflexile sp. TaxID=1979402 RepID=UPI003569BBC3
MTKLDLQGFIINKIKADVIDLTDENFEGLYSKWFNNEPSDKYIFNSNLVNKDNQSIPDEAYLLGVDLPYWFGDLNATNKKIMVVGIDPLRAESDFKQSDRKNDVIISTPYALHFKDNHKEKNAYWAFVNQLQSEHFVYLTDIYKTFFYVNKGASKVRSYVYNSGNRELKECLRQTIYSEIEFLKPDIIITFGGIAYSQLTGERSPKLSQNLEKTKTHLKVVDGYSVPVLPFLHLSGSTRGKNLDVFLKANNVAIVEKSRATYGRAYAEIISQHL